MELLGHGSRSFRKVAVDDSYRINTEVLTRAIAADRDAGAQPCAVIGNAGTINTGAVDDLAKLAAICRREKLWFHVDGAIGAVVALAPNHRQLVQGIEKADSVALDLHKWLHIPFEAACALVRDRQAHRATFSLTPDYLKHAQRGLARRADWFSDYRLLLTRCVRALKARLSFKEAGLDKYGRLIDPNNPPARRPAELVREEPELQLMAP